MTKLSPIAGKLLVKILCNKFGFRVIRQKGSHVTITNDTIYVTVPQKEIRVGLLSVILRDCGIARDEFLEYV
ncbi:type II toxin-antitoxin system HicA family toxin [Candidatus Nitrosotenuis aquarius]|uniref:type II toxin-antitoxin system HicA family toxin n=1 Tax=Candidatus Nitrosotenuis aquarius TaxID=1846278 RepID=UPI000C1EE261|nr:type II toxin-antitoxin system HicA family toxin [Candidatus Nitrosotenuis aquarius]